MDPKPKVAGKRAAPESSQLVQADISEQSLKPRFVPQRVKERVGFEINNKEVMVPKGLFQEIKRFFALVEQSMPAGVIVGFRVLDIFISRRTFARPGELPRPFVGADGWT